MNDGFDLLNGYAVRILAWVFTQAQTLSKLLLAHYSHHDKYFIFIYIYLP